MQGTILDFGTETGPAFDHDSETIKKYDHRDFPQFKATSRLQSLRNQQKKISSEFVKKPGKPKKKFLESWDEPDADSPHLHNGKQGAKSIQTVPEQHLTIPEPPKHRELRDLIPRPHPGPGRLCTSKP
jgi:hypothetical protein